MSELNSIISVTITRLTKPIGQKGFGTILIIGPNPTFTERIRFYTEDSLASLASVLTGGTASAEYKMAQTIFSQSPHATIIAVGKKLVGDTTYTDALNAVLLESRAFYSVACAVRTTGDQLSVSAWVQANGRVAVLASADANIIGQTVIADTTSIAALVKNATLDRTSVIYHSKAATEYADAALLGLISAWTPGTYTGAHKSLIGVTIDKLNPTESKNAHDKYASTYEEVGENNVLLFGYTGSGEYIDIPILADWTQSRIQENVWGVLARNKKVPFIDSGIAGIEAAVRQVLQIGMENTGFTPMSFDKTTGKQTGGYWTSFPAATGVPANDKAARRLTGGKFGAFLAGAIHTVAIEGVISFE